MDDTCRKKKETIGSDCIHINLIARAIDSVPPELQIALLLLSHSHSRATDSPSSTSGERPRPARTAPSHTDSSPPASGGDTRRRCGRHKGGRGERTGRGEDLANAFDGTDAVGLEIQNAARSQYQPMFSAALLSKLPPPPPLRRLRRPPSASLSSPGAALRRTAGGDWGIHAYPVITPTRRSHWSEREKGP